MTHDLRKLRREQGGFALILALFTLMLLTFLGLTLATSTSSELQIASNYRWAQQALYNAEAGLEIGKALLRNMNWSLVLPPARPAPSGGNTGCASGGSGPQNRTAGLRCWIAGITPVSTPPAAPYTRVDASGLTSRNYEGSPCDLNGNGLGYGVVLDDGGGFGPYQNVSTVHSQTINGSFTLWVRRPAALNADGSLSDEPGFSAPDDRIVLTAEGTAPFTKYAAGTIKADINRAIRTLEATYARTLDTPCGTRGGQVGGGPEGSNFSPCDPITGASIGNALGGGARTEASAAQ